MQSVECQPAFQRNISPTSSGWQRIILLVTCFHAGFLLNLFSGPWRWRRYVPPKRWLTLNGLHGFISQKIVLLFSDNFIFISNCLLCYIVKIVWYKGFFIKKNFYLYHAQKRCTTGSCQDLPLGPFGLYIIICEIRLMYPFMSLHIPWFTIAVLIVNVIIYWVLQELKRPVEYIIH
jgi:hypothetical protein